MQRTVVRFASYVFLTTSLFACADNDSPPGDDQPPVEPPPEDPPQPPEVAPNAVYVLSNEADANRIVVYARAADGVLRGGNAYATGGTGSAGGLGSQGALTYDDATKRFFAVNAGDNSISMLALEGDGSLRVLSHVPAGGVHPVSIAARGDLVYVVNGGNSTTAANIAGFRITNNALAALAGSAKPLGAAQPAPAQISFTPTGDALVVTEKATNSILTYALTDGVAGAPIVHASAGMTPFGFAWSAGGQLLVSEAFGGAAGMGAASSYTVGATGGLAATSSSVGSTQSAPCWVVSAKGHAYVTNTASNTISSYAVSATGTLTIDDAGRVAAPSGGGPIDADVSDGDGFLYVLDASSHAISGYAIAADGALTRLPDLAGVSASAVGMIAR